MFFSEIGYRGEYVQIPPSFRLIPESKVFMLGTSYGNPNLIEKLFDECQREFLAANQDFDVTSPFPKLTCLDGISNKIYTTLLFLNDMVYSNYNKKSYLEGFDFLLMQKVNQKLYWAQVGWPHIFIKSTHILGLDHSTGLRTYKNSKSPHLPHSLLGLHNSLNLRVESSNVFDNEEVLFVKAETISSGFYSQTSSENTASLKSIYESNPASGAWLGRLVFSDSPTTEVKTAQNL